MFLPVSIIVRPAHTHPRNAPFPLQPSRHGVPDSHERTTSKPREPSFAFYGRRDTLGATLHAAAPGRGEAAVLVTHLALCPALIFVLIFSESFDGQWMKKLLATII